MVWQFYEMQNKKYQKHSDFFPTEKYRSNLIESNDNVKFN